MKTLFSITLIFSFLFSSAQQSNSNDCEEKYILALKSIENSKPHRNGSLFTKCTLEENYNFLKWMINYNDCYTKSGTVDLVKIQSGFQVDFIRRNQEPSAEASKIIVKYKMAGTKIISASISGTWSDMADIYMNYWGGDFRKSDRKIGEVAYYTSLNDRIAFYNNKTNSSILITNNGNDFLEQYRCK